MSGFLDGMASSSERRVREAREREPLESLAARAASRPAPPSLRLSGGFDVIAELKLRSPAYGALGREADDWLGRVRDYVRGGAAAVSVLTEPSRFDGSLDHLRMASAALAPLGVPCMRKDFLVDPYQVWEARDAGAGGVLLIIRMLTPARLHLLLDCAAQCGLFVLLEAFDAADLELAAGLLGSRAQSRDQVLVGINCRDLQSLQVVTSRFESLAPLLPAGFAGVAESGINDAADARRAAAMGFRLALVGSALMSASDPARLLGEMLAAARTGSP